MNRVLLAQLIGVSIVVVGVLPSGATAQTLSSHPQSFAVSTVKPTSADSLDYRIQISGDSFIARNRTLRELIEFAFKIDNGQLSGGLGWCSTARFDVDAKMDTSDYEAQQGMSASQRADSLRSMLQRLLEDRFQLRTHRESRELPIYALTIGKSGSKLRLASPLPPSDSVTGASPAVGLRMRHGRLEARHVTVDDLVRALNQLPEVGGRMVVDRTGLSGIYDFALDWAPQAGGEGGPVVVGNVTPPVQTDAIGTSLFTAIQEQLGLKLESSKGPVDSLVIDSAEMPSAN